MLIFVLSFRYLGIYAGRNSARRIPTERQRCCSSVCKSLVCVTVQVSGLEISSEMWSMIAVQS